MFQESSIRPNSLKRAAKMASSIYGVLLHSMRQFGGRAKCMPHVTVAWGAAFVGAITVAV